MLHAVLRDALGSRAIYHDGWKATTDHVGAQLDVEVELLEGSRDFAADHWALFDLTRLRRGVDVAADTPTSSTSLVERWWAEAGANDVLPLDDSFIGRAIALEPSPWPVGWRHTYGPGGGPVAEDVLPRWAGSASSPTSRSRPAGHPTACSPLRRLVERRQALHPTDGRPVFCVVRRAGRRHRRPRRCVGAGSAPHRGRDHRQRAGGPVVLLVDGAPVADARLGCDLPFRWQIGGAGLRIAHDSGLPGARRLRFPPAELRGADLAGVTIEATALAPPDVRERLRVEPRLRVAWAHPRRSPSVDATAAVPSWRGGGTTRGERRAVTPRALLAPITTASSSSCGWRC
ncbi:MAG: hypothetical protein R2699_04120 [Acidimicrobiales bacterium]